MVQQRELRLSYHYSPGAEALGQVDKNLIFSAQEATSLSYSPYSGFCVGAAILLDDGSILKGANQENASFPVGICAERVALSVASSLHPSAKIKAIALTLLTMVWKR